MSHPQMPQLTNQEIIVAPDTSAIINLGPSLSEKKMGKFEVCCKKECRVCLQEEIGDNELMSICMCTGSLKYIHKVCLENWLLKKYEQSEDKTAFKEGAGLFCEICHSPYLIDYSLQWAWADCSSLVAKMKANKCVAAINTIFVLADIICLIFTCEYAVDDYKNQDYNMKEPKYFLVYVAILLAFLSTLYGINQFVKMFLLEEKVVVGKSKIQADKKYVYEVQSSMRHQFQAKNNQRDV